MNVASRRGGTDAALRLARRRLSLHAAQIWDGRGERVAAPSTRPASPRPGAGQRGGMKSARSSARRRGSSPWTLWPASATCSTRALGLTADELGLGLVVDDGADSHPAHEHDRHGDPLERVPQVFGRQRPLGRLAAAGEAPVPPHPAAVLPLERVVEDAPAQRRLRAGRVELHRAGQELVEVGEALGPVHEGDDRRRARAFDPRRDVDQHHLARRGPGDRRPARSWSARRATCRPRPTPAGASSPITAATSAALVRTSRLPSAGASECPWPGRSIATSGRPSAMATVSQVWAFWAPPCRSTSSGGASPHTSALRCRPGPTSTDGAADDGWPVVGETELRRVLVEQPELVVLDATSHDRSLPWRGATSGYESSASSSPAEPPPGRGGGRASAARWPPRWRRRRRRGTRPAPPRRRARARPLAPAPGPSRARAGSARGRRRGARRR